MKIFKFGNLYIAYTEKEDGNQRLKENRKKVKERLSLDKIYIPVQKHTNIIVDYRKLPKKADGIFTGDKKVAIGVLTADCMPIVLFDGKALCVVHAGWRGLFSGIIQNGLEILNKKCTQAFIMPSIRDCCYEVDHQFILNLNINEKFYSKSKKGIYLSLQKIAKDILKNEGIDKIYEVPMCTGCCDRLYSYRKGDFEDRILTVSWFE